MSHDVDLSLISDEVRNNHPEAVACALANGEVPLGDGRWRAADGRIIDPQLGNGEKVPLNVGFLYGVPVIVAVLLPVTWLTVGLGWQEFAALIVMWLVAGFGVTVGYHRLFSHRTYKAHWTVRLALAIAGGLAVQNSALVWSRDHRYHHGQVDTIGDPYNARRGFWFSHFQWVLSRGAHSGDMSNVADLQADPIVMWQYRNYNWIVWGLNIAIVLALGALTGRYLQMFVVAGLLRILFVQHGTFLINSWAHMFGDRPWSTGNTARDNFLLSLLTFGEGYHNYHHAFANDYRNGVRWHHFDPSKWMIFTLSLVGLTWDLQRVHAEVTLKHRMDEKRQSLAERLRAAGEGQLEDWSAGLLARRESLSAAVEQRRLAFEESRAALYRQMEGAADAMREAYDHGAHDLQAHYDERMHAFEQAKHDLEQWARDARAAAGLRLVAAEKAAEDALKELRQRRRAWIRQRAAGTVGRDELKRLKAAIRVAQDEAHARWDEFERQVREVEARFAPQVA